MTQTPPDDPTYGRRTRPGEAAELGAIIAKAEAAFAARIRQLVPDAQVSHLGVYDIFPTALGFWVVTQSDATRDTLLAAHQTLEAELRQTLAAHGYPQEALSRIGFTAESEESVQRDYGGNWYYRMK